VAFVARESVQILDLAQTVSATSWRPRACYQSQYSANLGSRRRRMMSIRGAPGTRPGDPPSETSWGFSGQVVRLVLTRDQAEATIRFFSCIRKSIAASPKLGEASRTVPPLVTPEDSQRWAMGELSAAEQADAIMRALKAIALDPAGRADTLLSLDAHIAYLCGRFALLEPA
jgi:hypothetical protein